MGIVEFLEARIAEDEAVAKAARPGPWFHDSNLTCGPRVPPDDFLMVPEDPSDTISPCNDKIPDQDSRHIARHDPARILCEVAAKRKLIRSIEGLVQHAYGYDSAGTVEKVLAPLAAIYSDHPDFNEEWRP
ncbi:DUF6221 family protein [Rhodococcus qingshengii]|uniref:DUF6221 family protein n=1 Tax=Rhodococcus qingshengii TaxID=334542 RepID=UPI002AFF6718|nr:DUF6221 family protein [Rhodococcus qingshengii]MEA1796685.1 DUF6221 family protein [Rhodococcus qingshengii]